MDIYIIREILKMRRVLIIHEKIERMTKNIAKKRQDIQNKIFEHNSKYNFCGNIHIFDIIYL